MKDEQLFQRIKNAIKQKQFSPHEVKPTTFAEQYCTQQLRKKKLNPFNPNKKMSNIMEHFKGLQTYINLPELIGSIQKEKQTQIQESIPKFLLINSKNKNVEDLQSKIKNILGQQMKRKYLMQHSKVDQLLQILQKQSSFRSEGLKNYSDTNFNSLFDKVTKEGDDFAEKKNSNFFQFWTKSNTIHNQSEQLSFQIDRKVMKQNQMINKAKKQTRNLLRKVGTYLQIILQSQHKRKWDLKKNKFQMNNLRKIKSTHKQNKFFESAALPNLHKQSLVKLSKQSKRSSNTVLKSLNKNKNKNKDENENENSFIKKQNSVFSQTLSLKKSNYGSTNREINRNHHHKQHMSLHQQKVSFHNIKYEDQDENNQKTTLPSQKFNNSILQQKNINSIVEDSSFCKNTASFQERIKGSEEKFKLYKKKSLLRQSLLSGKNLKNGIDVKKSFTFRNRNIKQNIINKLTNFIQQIDEQEVNNKKQSCYYNAVLDKLDRTLKTSFGQFKQQILAGDDDIQNLKNYADQFQTINLINSNQNISLNLMNFLKLIKKQAQQTQDTQLIQYFTEQMEQQQPLQQINIFQNKF